jgi:hypothetical protein
MAAVLGSFLPTLETYVLDARPGVGRAGTTWLLGCLSLLVRAQPESPLLSVLIRLIVGDSVHGAVSHGVGSSVGVLDDAVVYDGAGAETALARTGSREDAGAAGCCHTGSTGSGSRDCQGRSCFDGVVFATLCERLGAADEAVALASANLLSELCSLESDVLLHRMVVGPLLPAAGTLLAQEWPGCASRACSTPASCDTDVGSAPPPPCSESPLCRSPPMSPSHALASTLSERPTDCSGAEAGVRSPLTALPFDPGSVEDYVQGAEASVLRSALLFTTWAGRAWDVVEVEGSTPSMAPTCPFLDVSPCTHTCPCACASLVVFTYILCLLGFRATAAGCAGPPGGHARPRQGPEPSLDGHSCSDGRVPAPPHPRLLVSCRCPAGWHRPMA